jgi:flagellin
MSLSINTNSSASIAASNLSGNNTMLQKSLQRLSSGTRIVDAADDAGGLAVSMKMSAAIRRTEATNTNLSNAQSFLKTQDGAFATATKVLTRMSELSILSQDVTKTTGDTANYQTEFGALQTQLSDLGAGTFNGVSMFGTGATATTVTVYTNEDSSTSTTVSKAAFTGDVSMAAAISAGTSLANTSSSQAATTSINSALTALATMRAKNGAEASKLSFGQEMLVANKNNLEAANSRIIDVDVAAESTQLARYTILQQAGTAMLAQANQSAQSVLKLLQG